MTYIDYSITLKDKCLICNKNIKAFAYGKFYENEIIYYVGKRREFNIGEYLKLFGEFKSKINKEGKIEIFDVICSECQKKRDKIIYKRKKEEKKLKENNK